MSKTPLFHNNKSITNVIKRIEYQNKKKKIKQRLDGKEYIKFFKKINITSTNKTSHNDTQEHNRKKKT